MHAIDCTAPLFSRPAFYFSSQMTLAVDFQHKPIVCDFANPGRYWSVTENEKLLLCCFNSSSATTTRNAVLGYLRHIHQKPTESSVGTALGLLTRFVDAGILVAKQVDSSAYTPEMIASYSNARHIPSQVCDSIVKTGSVHRQTRILDVATGTGEIARRLAEISEEVTGIDVSRSFLEVARFQAKTLPHPPKFLQGCANKLLLHNSIYDVVTLCQAFHWLNPALAVQGLEHVVAPNGLLFLIESKSMLPDFHPLRLAFKYGDSDEAFVKKECVRQANWYVKLFDLLRQSGSLLQLRNVALFREHRVFDLDYARAFFFEHHVRTALGSDHSPWAKLEELFLKRNQTELSGDLFWLVMCFQKLSVSTNHLVREISYSDIELIA